MGQGEDGFLEPMFLENRIEEDGKAWNKARCPDCGKEIHSVYSPFGRKRSLQKLQRQFNQCTCCGRFVCNDCYVIFDGQDMVGLCLTCAGKRGISGVTTTMDIQNRKNRHGTDERNL